MRVQNNICKVSQFILHFSPKLQRVQQIKIISTNIIMRNRKHKTHSSFQNNTTRDFFNTGWRKRQSLGSTRNTFNTKIMSQSHRQHYQPKNTENMPLEVWNQSATTMTRGHSPQHKFPQQKRFRSLEQDRARSQGDINKLHLRTHLKSGQSFACSKRKTYFPPQQIQQNPSPWQHDIKRWLQQTSEYHNSLNKTNNSFLNYYKNRKCYSSVVKGRTITKQKRDNSKYYLDHARVHSNHHQKIVIGHPGVGKYTLQIPVGKDRPSYTMGELFHHCQDVFPAPNSYKNDVKMTKPSTLKETIDRAKRLDLSKPLNDHPGPGQYKIIRFLQSRTS